MKPYSVKIQMNSLYGQLGEESDTTIIHMVGMTCIHCGKGYYPGYATADKTLIAPSISDEFPLLTAPCTVCKRNTPAQMTRKAFKAAIHERDKYPR